MSDITWIGSTLGDISDLTNYSSAPTPADTILVDSVAAVNYPTGNDSIGANWQFSDSQNTGLVTNQATLNPAAGNIITFNNTGNYGNINLTQSGGVILTGNSINYSVIKDDGTCTVALTGTAQNNGSISASSVQFTGNSVNMGVVSNATFSGEAVNNGVLE